MDRQFIESVLLRCFIYGFVLLLFWFVLFLAAGGWMYDFHSAMFDITEHEFNVMNYCGMGLLKILVFVGFLIPYIAIRLTARKQKPSN
jgi:hypothetical protein